MRSLCIAICAVQWACAAIAQDVPARFQDDRVFFNALLERACAGELDAYHALADAAWDDWNAVALNNLGLAHSPTNERCPGVATDLQSTISAYELSAEAGYPIAMTNLATFVLRGDYVARDVPFGLNLLTRAAELGWFPAAERLARITARGLYGQPVDARQAWDWVARARNLGISSEALAQLSAQVEEAVGAEPGPGSVPAATAAASNVEDAPAANAGGRGPGGDVALYYVFSGRTLTGAAPRLGEMEDWGSFTRELVFVAQLHDRNHRDGGLCWTAADFYLLAYAMRVTSPAGARDVEIFRRDAQLARDRIAAGEPLATTELTHFDDLDEGLRWWGQINRDGNDMAANLLPMWSIVDAATWGPRCEFDTRPHSFPAPERLPGH